MAEWSNAALQVVNPGESVIFTNNPVPCRTGLIRHRDDTGSFLLTGYVNACSCVKSAEYLCDFGANISIPTEGGTAGTISLAIAIDGNVIASSEMSVTPAAVEDPFNVSRAVNVPIWRGCCETVSVINTSDQPIQVENANIIFTRPDLRR